MIEFAAVVAYTGVETRGGWYLAPLADDEPVPVTKPLPLPVTGQPGAGHGRIGWMERLAYLRDAVVARGFLDNTAAGRDYAGALALGLVRLVMEGETGRWQHDDHGDRGPVCCEEWRISGLVVHVAPAWDLPKPQIELRGLL